MATQMIRVELNDEQKRDLRVIAAYRHVSVASLLGSIIRAALEQAPELKGA